MDVKYDSRLDEIQITMEGITHSISLSKFLEQIEVDLARLEFLKCKAYEIRKQRFDEIDKFMEKIIDLTAGIEAVRKKMLNMDPATEGKSIRALGEVIKAYSAQKNILKEMRFAIKLLDNIEGRIWAEIGELKV